MKIRLSQQQLNYAAAKVAYDIAREAHNNYGLLMDKECEKLGIATPFGILPEGHPMWAHAQALLDVENAARQALRTAAHDLFDWATKETFKRCGTAEQKKSIMEMVDKVKTMAFVEKPFIQLVDASMRLAA